MECRESQSRHDRVAERSRQGSVAALKKAGFEVVRVKGSHHFLRHPDGRTTVVPVHAGETIGPGLLSKVLRDCELDREELQKLL